MKLVWQQSIRGKYHLVNVDGYYYLCNGALGDTSKKYGYGYSISPRGANCCQKCLKKARKMW